MSRPRKNARTDLIEQVLMAGRENGIHAILFQQTVGQILGLNATDMKCLDAIALSETPVTPSLLAEFTGLTTGAVTLLIDRLEGARLIERKPDPDDRRRTILTPTRRAMKVVPPLYASMGKAMFGLASTFSDTELKAIERFFKGAAGIFESQARKLREQHED